MVSVEQLVDAMRVCGVRSQFLRQINSLLQVGIKYNPIKVSRSRRSHIIAFDRGRLRKAAEIEMFGLCIHRSTPICPPLPPLKNYSRGTDVISIYHVLCFQRESSLTFCLACWCGCLLRVNLKIDKLFSIPLLSVM